MKNRNKKFDVTKFEHLVISNDVLKGGFSQALTATGGVSNVALDLNLAKGCGPIINNEKDHCGLQNYVAGCGGKK